MYHCNIHGEQKTNCCEECNSILSCDCEDRDSARFKDLIYDVDGIGERTITVTIHYCKTCGDAVYAEV